MAPAILLFILDLSPQLNLHLHKVELDVRKHATYFHFIPQLDTSLSCLSQYAF